jgi:hypothetical protein
MTWEKCLDSLPPRQRRFVEQIEERAGTTDGDWSIFQAAAELLDELTRDNKMKLTIEIDLDNAAFEDEGVDEIDRILGDIASRLPMPLRSTDGKLNLHDLNGHHCGTAEIR